MATSAVSDVSFEISSGLGDIEDLFDSLEDEDDDDNSFFFLRGFDGDLRYGDWGGLCG